MGHTNERSCFNHKWSSKPIKIAIYDSKTDTPLMICNSISECCKKFKINEKTINKNVLTDMVHTGKTLYGIYIKRGEQ